VVERLSVAKLDGRKDEMGKKCCQRKPRCKDCPKRKEKKASVAVDGNKMPIFYFVAPAEMSISGQRGCTAKSPAGFAGVPACRRRHPASAIIAPLSVQNSSSG